MTHCYPVRLLRFAAFCLAILSINAYADPVPEVLPDPDGEPGDNSRPVQVYILAGQSNMVGMGQLTGATNLYSAVYLTNDPDAMIGPVTIFKVGSYYIDRLGVFTADGQASTDPIASGLLTVPTSGTYLVQVGAGDNTNYTMQLSGQTAYQFNDETGQATRTEIQLRAGERYPFAITGIDGTPPRIWLEQTHLEGHGDLDSVVNRDGMFPWLADEEGNWTVRQDVYYQEVRIAENGRGEPLTATSNGNTIGPEVAFGYVMGTFHGEQVLLIESSMGNRALGYDFRPPTSGRNDPDSEWEGAEWRHMVEGVNETLENIADIVPGYDGQGYEIAGFVWWQGHKDGYSEELMAEYETNMVNMINDVRAEFDAPQMPAVIATVGFGGHNMGENYQRIHAAQMAVADPQRHPEFAGQVATVDIVPFWREVHESPKSEGHHYNRNAETYCRVGDALGRAMVQLRGGEAEPLTQPSRPAPVIAAAEPTEEEQARSRTALAPIITDGIAKSYITNPRYDDALLAEARGQRPDRANQFLNGAMYGLENCYLAAGISDYDWQPFGPDLSDAPWHVMSFDPPETQPAEQANRFREVTWPQGSENWLSPDFDPAAAGWATGQQPFGQNGGELRHLQDGCTSSMCGCGVTPRTLWEHEVIMVRQTIALPDLQDGYRYRVVIGGVAHVNSGEGYAIYIDGDLVNQSTTGVPNRQGGQARGGHIYADIQEHLEDGQIDLCVYAFLRYSGRHADYPRGHLTVRLEQQLIPPAIQAVLGSDAGE